MKAEIKGVGITLTAENDAESIAMQHILNNDDGTGSWLTWIITDGTSISSENNNISQILEKL